MKRLLGNKWIKSPWVCSGIRRGEVESSVLLGYCALSEGVRFRCTVSKKLGNELFSDGRNMPENASKFFSPFYGLTLHSPRLTSQILSILRPYFTFNQAYISTSFHSTALHLHSSRTSNTLVSTIHIICSVYLQAQCTERIMCALVGVCVWFRGDLYLNF